MNLRPFSTSSTVRRLSYCTSWFSDVLDNCSTKTLACSNVTAWSCLVWSSTATMYSLCLSSSFSQREAISPFWCGCPNVGRSKVECSFWKNKCKTQLKEKTILFKRLIFHLNSILSVNRDFLIWKCNQFGFYFFDTFKFSKQFFSSIKTSKI